MSQADSILAALQRGEVLTTLDIFKLCGSMAGHSRIAELRRQGWNIECTEVARSGRRRWEYRLRAQLSLALLSEPQKRESPRNSGSRSGLAAPASADTGGIDAPF